MTDKAEQIAAGLTQREAVGGKMLNVARRNLRTFIGLASFKSENDREAALNCLEVIEAELSCLNDLVAVPRSALAADAALTTPAPAVSRDEIDELLYSVIRMPLSNKGGELVRWRKTMSGRLSAILSRLRGEG